MSYEQLYELYEKYKWADGGGFAMFARVQAQWKVEAVFGDRFRTELDAVHKEIYPRRRKIVHANIPANIIDGVRRYWSHRAVAWYTCVLGRLYYLKRKLDELAVTVVLEPLAEEHVLHETSTGDYRSQGFGAHRYAKMGAQRYADALSAHGFQAEVRSRRPIEGSDYTEYRVYANALPWQMDVCLRRGGSLLDHCVKLWKRNVNPKVYYPFLDDAIFDKSCDIAMSVAK